jgi:hypothetical protein
MHMIDLYILALPNRPIMKNIFTLLMLGAIPYTLIAQCTVTVPANAIVISTTGGPNAPVTGNGQSYWVCSGVHRYFEGNGNTFYLETWTDVVITGSELTIYMKQGDLDGGSSFLMINGGEGSVIYRAQPEANIMNAGAATVNECDVMTFNYSISPPTGCMIIMGVPTHENESLQMYPNPASSELTISMNGASQWVRILDAQGRLAMERSGANVMKLDVSALPAGLYTILVEGDGQRHVQKFQKVDQ